jgi:hypothetical protein
MPIKSTEISEDVALHFSEITCPRKQYQWLTERLAAATVEDQFDARAA